jgi:hypothetical protein
MTRKIKLLLVAFFAILMLSNLSAQAFDMGGDKAMPGTATAGVAGAAEDKLLAETKCPSTIDGCRQIFRKQKNLYDDIRKDRETLQILKSMSSSECSSDLEKKVEKLQKKYENAKKDKKQKFREELTLNKKKLELLNNPVDAATVNARIDEKLQEMKQVKEESDRLVKGEESAPVEEEKSTDGELLNFDQFDVTPQNNLLNDGELVAWGIPRPGIPSIPKPKKNTSSSSSSSSSTSSQKQVSDETYKALRSVEENSAKVTDSEKDQFLSELNQRAATDN